MLGVPPLKEEHNANNMSALLTKILAEFGISKENIHLILRDGASAMVKMARVVGIESFHCFLHILNLVS